MLTSLKITSRSLTSASSSAIHGEASTKSPALCSWRASQPQTACLFYLKGSWPRQSSIPALCRIVIRCSKKGELTSKSGAFSSTSRPGTAAEVKFLLARLAAQAILPIKHQFNHAFGSLGFGINSIQQRRISNTR